MSVASTRYHASLSHLRRWEPDAMQEVRLVSRSSSRRKSNSISQSLFEPSLWLYLPKAARTATATSLSSAHSRVMLTISCNVLATSVDSSDSVWTGQEVQICLVQRLRRAFVVLLLACPSPDCGSHGWAIRSTFVSATHSHARDGHRQPVDTHSQHQALATTTRRHSVDSGAPRSFLTPDSRCSTTTLDAADST